MLKKTITYTDFLGTTRTEDLYFNLTKMDLTDMQMSVDGGMRAKLEKMINAVNNKEIYKTFTEIVLASYGELSPDGKYHIKVDEDGHRLADKFKQSLAYEALMDEVCQSEETIAEFCNGIIPQSILEQAEKAEKEENKPHPVK